MLFHIKRMIQLHNPFYRFYSLILFVTSRCDGRCKGCLYDPKLNKKKDMLLDDYKKISHSIGNIWHLQISGGEPFLRKDLYEICKLFIKNNKTKLITIPTNGLNKNNILKTLNKLLKLRCKIGISISLDGTKKINDYIRGKNTFNKSISTLNELKLLEKSHKNLFLTTSTRIIDKNVHDIPLLLSSLKSFNLKKIGLFPIRGHIDDDSINIPSKDQYERLIKKINFKPNQSDKIKYDIIKNSLSKKKWFFPCIAGKKIGVIDSDGDVRLCELLEPIGNIKKENFDFYKIWNSKKADEQRNIIRSGKCSKGCTHGCFLWPSLLNNPFNIIRHILKNFLKKNYL